METPFGQGAVVVTGAASGIGRAAAIAFGRRGAYVIVSDVADGQHVADEIHDAGGAARFIGADVSCEQDVIALMHAAVQLRGSICAAFNNAGIAGPAGAFEDQTLEGWQRVLKTNLTSIFLCMREEVR